MVLTATPSAALGTTVPDFDLPGIDGKSYQPSDFTGRALVVIFTCNHCPYAKAVWPRLIRLADEYTKKRVDFVAINSNEDNNYPEDSFENMKIKAREWGINIPYLRDESQAVAKAFGAVCTPDFFVYDSQHQLVYRGRFDDNWKDETKVARQDLKEAFDTLLAGQPVPRDQHPSMGCSIKWKLGSKILFSL